MNDGQNEQARIAAAKELLDRAHGKPRQELEVGRKQLVVIIDPTCGGKVKLTGNRAPQLIGNGPIVDHSTDDGEDG